MKKRILTVFTALLFLFVSLAGYAAAEEEPAWEITRSAGITEEARAAFDRAAAQPDLYCTYEPEALLAQSGDVYCFLCRRIEEDPEAQPSYVLLYVNGEGIQNEWSLWIDEHSRPRAAEEPEEQAIDLRTLIDDLASADDALQRIRTDLDALEGDEMAAFTARTWENLYFNPDFRVWVDGKDDPAALPVAGKHAFVVLGLALEDGGMPEELKARCDAAAAAAKQFPDSALICSGGVTGGNDPEEHTEAGLMKEYLIQSCGIPAERIFTDETAETTLDNAVNTFQILKEQGIGQITVVTSDYHQRRAAVLFETLAEYYRENGEMDVTFAGNYSCAAETPEDYLKNDAQIAAWQLETLMDTLTGEPADGE